MRVTLSWRTKMSEDFERILVIKPHLPASISHRSNVREQYGISNEQLDRLIESGEALDHNGKAVCFDLPISEAYA